MPDRLCIFLGQEIDQQIDIRLANIIAEFRRFYAPLAQGEVISKQSNSRSGQTWKMRAAGILADGKNAVLHKKQNYVVTALSQRYSRLGYKLNIAGFERISGFNE